MAGAGSPWLATALPLLLLLAAAAAGASAASEADILIAFRDTLTNGPDALRDWQPGSSPCVGGIQSVWTGVICFNSTIYGLQLENMRLSGMLNLDMLHALPTLRALSFMNNAFSGTMPSLAKLPALKTIYLSRNRFSGVIPADEFKVTAGLKKVHLSWNDFSGLIPASLADLEKLVEMRLDGNGFSGEIPKFKQVTELELFNVSNNDLDGRIPDEFSKMDPSSFAGNKDLCGPPLTIPCPPPGSPPGTESPKSSKKLSSALLIAIIVVVVGIILALLGLILAFCCRKRGEEARLGRPPSVSRPKKYEMDSASKVEQGQAVYAGAVAKKPAKDEHGKLVFVREGKEKFDMQDLLKSSAEVLGSGNFGSSYKAALMNGPAVVVKRFKDMNGVGREDFQEHMRRLGRLSHPNLLPLLAYYYRREEKLLVTECIPFGSLAHFLHGNRSSNHPALDWPTRLKIVKGVARGLAYLYDELPMLTLPHGHLKSSNVLLDDSFEPLLTDYALAPVMNQAHASQVMVAYKSPEFTQFGKTSKKSDVWSFGILILEILTGKFPANNLKQGNAGTDLASWVNSVVREEWTGEVFDSEMKATRSGGGEMMKLLKIGLGCCEPSVDKRWDLSEALVQIEELKVKEVDEDYSSYVSEGEVYSSIAMSEDEFSFSRKN